MAYKDRTVMKSHAIRGAAHFASTELHVLRRLAGKSAGTYQVAAKTAMTRAASTSSSKSAKEVHGLSKRAKKT